MLALPDAWSGSEAIASVSIPRLSERASRRQRELEELDDDL